MIRPFNPANIVLRLIHIAKRQARIDHDLFDQRVRIDRVAELIQSWSGIGHFLLCCDHSLRHAKSRMLYPMTGRAKQCEVGCCGVTDTLIQRVLVMYV